MTIEEKAKAYDEAYERAKKLKETCDSNAVVGWMEYIFPELKESEDEKIRKALIRFHKSSIDIDGIKGDDILAWLEKQGKKESNKIPIWKHWKDGIAGNGEGKSIYLVKYGHTYSLSSCLCFECDYIELSELDKLMFEKQGEQKVTVVDFKAKDWYVSKVDGKIRNIYHSVDEVEPKFKVGDWILLDKPCQIKSISKYGNYIVKYWDDEGISTLSRKFCETYFHLWTIQDAKDGDVLASKNKLNILIFRNLDTSTSFSSYYNIAGKGELGWSNECFIPATKEQRDTLIQAMTDAGYTFDFEKKELKKISQRMISAEAKEAMYDKPTDEEMKELLRTEYEKGRADAIAEMQVAWSEEDERNLRLTEYAVMKFFGGDCSLVGWLRKSLKDRCTWKPSDEQMLALKHASNDCSIAFADMKILATLYEQLKALHRYEQDT